MLTQPFEERFTNSRRVLVAGAGGGFDVVCALPLCLALEAVGRKVHLANFSFTSLQQTSGGVWHTETLLEVTPEARGPEYFPELNLAKWFQDRLSQRRSIWCFAPTGAVPYTDSYLYLVKRLEIDTVVVVDGGVDTLLRGDEHSLGTPLWDALTLAAVSQLQGVQRLLVSTAFGAERWDRISHAEVLNRVADLVKEDGFLGAEALLPGTSGGKQLKDAVEFIFSRQRGSRPSVVASSLLAALRGEFGEMALNPYTEMTPIWVSPLMLFYLYFDLMTVVQHKLYLDRLLATRTLAEAAERLREWTEGQAQGAWTGIPI